MTKLDRWADQLESRMQAAPEVIAVGPRPLGHRRVIQKGLLGTAAVLIWAAQHWGLPGDHVLPPIPVNQAAPTLALAVQRLSVPTMVPARLAAISLLLTTAVTAPPSNVQLARDLLAQPDPRARFLALAVTLEQYKDHPYRDSAGLNVGIGYCVTRRVQEEGEARVRQDLAQAGLSPNDVATLLGHDRRAQRAVTLSETQAVALLRAVAPDYEARARAFVGEATFEALPAHRQAALTWLAYNTGPHLEQFRHLRQAVQENKPDQALGHLTPTYTDGAGVEVANVRAGAYLAAAYWSDQGLLSAVNQADRFEALTATATTPAQVGKLASAWVPSPAASRAPQRRRAQP